MEREKYLETVKTLDNYQISYHKVTAQESTALIKSFQDLMHELTCKKEEGLSYIDRIVRMMKVDEWLWKGKEVTYDSHINLLNQLFLTSRELMIQQNIGYHIVSTGGWTMEVDAYKGTVRVNFHIFDNILQPDTPGFFELNF